MIPKVVRELDMYASRFPRDGKSGRWCATIYALRALRGALFGYNPNYPFPVSPGYENRGLVGQFLFDSMDLFKGAVRYGRKLAKWIALAVTLVWLLAPRETTKHLVPLWTPIATRLERSMVELAVADGVEVREGLHVALPQDFDEDLTKSILKIIREEDARVTKLFGQNLKDRIVIEVEWEGRKGREPNTEVLGSYDTTSSYRLGAHRIKVTVLGALNRGVVAHELTHAHVLKINPALNLLLNEGMAHFVEVESQFSSKSWTADELVANCEYPSQRHWIEASSRSNSDTIRSRALGYVVVHYLHKAKGYPLKEIPNLKDSDLPSHRDILDHLQGLKIDLVKRTALDRKEDDLDLLFWQEAYLVSQNQRDWTVPDEEKSSKGTEQRFQNLMNLTVQHLRWSGKTDAEISAMTPESIMASSDEAVAKLPERLELLGLRHGEIAFEALPHGIFDRALKRLFEDSYRDTALGRLERAKDQGWARVFAAKVIFPDKPFPQYSNALRDSIAQKIGHPSIARRALGDWEFQSIKDDGSAR